MKLDPIKETILNKFSALELYCYQLDNKLFLNRNVEAKITLMDSRTINKDAYDMIKNQLYMMHDAVKSCVVCPIGRYIRKVKNLVLDPHVFSNLNYKAKFMIIAQNPGEQECIANTPLIGPSGKNLDNILKKFNLDRDLFYITNIVKCYTAYNRKPTNEEILNCRPWLDIEINLLKPKIIITFGAASLNAFFPDLNLTPNVNKVLEYNRGIKILPTFHPSPRNLTNKDRKGEFEKTFYIISKLLTKMKEENEKKEKDNE